MKAPKKAQTFVIEEGLSEKIQMILIKSKIQYGEKRTISEFVNEAVKSAIKRAER